MNKAPWTDGDRHPNADLLLLNLEGELDPKEAAAIEEHLKHCWSCRARSERMQRSICAFVEHRDVHVLPNLPSCPSEGAVFRARLTRIAADPPIVSSACLLLLALVHRHRHTMRNTWEYHRPRLLSAMVATAMVVALVTLPVVDPPAITAAVLLERARASRESVFRGSPRAGVYQRVEIRHGGRAITRDLYQRLPKPASRQPESSNDFEELFRKAGFNWDDPLNVQAFSDWHDALVRKQDTVRATDKQFTLTTRAEEGSPVAEASLTIRQTDWHPVAETIQLQGVDGPVEIEELGFEIRESKATVEARVTGAHHTMALRRLQRPEPREDELQIAEAELREALHKAGADVREAPQIWRNNDQVLFYILADQPGRRLQILQSVDGIPHVAESLQMQPVPASASQVGGPRQLRTIDPPFGNGIYQSQTANGGIPAFSVLGTTTSLVSVDALQEFRLESSTYAPEFGRESGGQVVLVTRSGTNSFQNPIFRCATEAKR
jgi:hypothetical protein